MFVSLRRLLLRTMPVPDPWRRYKGSVPAALYGSGAHRDFAWYLEGESGVAVSSVADLQVWLLGCEYVRDPDLFHKPDVWQHPSVFERLRKGDCEDFALWTWRKLVELGYEAELVAGHYAHAANHACGHAWVVYRDGQDVHLFDPVMREPAAMIRSLRESRHEYVPEFSVDARLNRYVFGGYLLRLRQTHRPAIRSIFSRVRASNGTAAPSAP